MEQATKCSREGSRRAQSRVQKILKLSNLDASSLSADCPLNPAHDMFLFQQNHMEGTSRGNMKCAYCGKVFTNQFYLDRHMDNKHSEKFLQNASTCFSDFCDVLFCDESRENLLGCTELEMKRRQHRCRNLFDTCLPTDNQQQLRFHEYFVHDYCDQISCDQRIDPLDAIDHNNYSNEPASMGAGKMVVLFFLAVTLVIFYGANYHMYRDFKSRDLRPLKSRQRPWLVAIKSIFKRFGSHKDNRD